MYRWRLLQRICGKARIESMWCLSSTVTVTRDIADGRWHMATGLDTSPIRRYCPCLSRWLLISYQVGIDSLLYLLHYSRYVPRSDP